MATGAEIYRMFQEGKTTPLEFAFDIVQTLYREFEDEAKELKIASDQMMQYWEGDSADMASKGIAPLIDAHIQSAPLIKNASGSMTSQAETFSKSQSAVTPVPDEPAEPGAFAKAAGIIAPGTGFADDYHSYRDGMAAHEAANANNVRVMNQYSAATDDTRSALPADFGIVEDDGAVINIGTHAASAPAGAPTAGPSLGGASGLTAGGAPVAGGHTAGPTFGGPGATSGGLPGGATSGVQQPGVTSTPNPGAPTPAPRPAGGMPIAPVGAPIGGGDGNDTRRTRGRGTTARPPAGSSRAGARMTAGSTPKSDSAAGRIQRGAGAAAKYSGGSPQPGKSAGVAGPTSSGSTTAGAKGMTGVARGGAPGGMAGAGAGRGQGNDEDKEHKDKYAIKEELDAGLDTEVDELGEKVIDDQTGNTVVPPVIGDTVDGGKG